MSEFIERQAVMEALLHEQYGYLCEDAVKAIPAADVVPVRHGEWFISIGKDGDPIGTICPICGFAWSEAIAAVMHMPSLSLIKTPYCPNCGASMKEKENNG